MNTIRLDRMGLKLLDRMGLEIVDELSAVRASRMQESNPVTTKILNSLKRSASKLASRKLSDDSRGQFESAGWVFAKNEESTAEAIRSMSHEIPEAATHRVFRDANGEIYVETPRLVMQLNKSSNAEKAIAQIVEKGLKPIRKLNFAPNLFEVSTKGRGALVAIDKIKQAGVEYCEPQLLQRIQGRFRPTDPQYNRQWQWNNDGSSGGIARADVRAELAWDTTLGRGVRVAVIDNGMQINHPDLESAIQCGGYFEDDGTGSGPFVRRENDPANFPGSNHGTFCMGMVGARSNNNIGGCGGAPESILIPIACLADQIGTQATLARALAYAADPTTEDASASSEQGADVISCSLGPNGADWTMMQVLKDAIDFAVTKGRKRASGALGTPIFWAVSNGNFPVARDEVCAYVNTIGVGRSSRLDIDDGSAFGPELEFLAPGVEVFSTKQNNHYGTGTGTSYAAPCAASVAALVLAVSPNLTWTEVRDRLRATAAKIGPDPYVGRDFGGRNDTYGYGRIDASTAITLP